MSIADIAKAALAAAKDIDNASLRIDLCERILALREASLALQEENTNLKDEMKSQQDAASLRAHLFFGRNVYWSRDEARVIAYCPGCFDNRGKLITLVHAGLTEYGDCPICKMRYLVQWHLGRPPPPST